MILTWKINFGYFWNKYQQIKPHVWSSTSTLASLSDQKHHIVQYHHSEPLLRNYQIRPPLNLVLSVCSVCSISCPVSSFTLGQLWLADSSSFPPSDSSKDKYSFLRSARDSWKAPLFGHFLALLLLTAVLCHTVTGPFCDWMCHSEEKYMMRFIWKNYSDLIFSISFVCHLSFWVYFGSFISLWAINTELVQSSSSWLLAQSQVSSCPVQLNDTHLPHPWLSSPSLQLPSWPYMGEFISEEPGRSQWPKEAMGS